MKRVIFILGAIALQVLYYLALFEVIETNIFSNFWMRCLTMISAWFAGCVVVGICVKHIRKWIYNIIYTLLLICSVALYLNLSGVYLGSYTHAIIFITILPLIYGAYIYCDESKANDSWHFIPKIDLEKSLIVAKPDDIEDSEAVVARSYIGAYNLHKKNKIYSTEILKYAQGEFKSLEQYLFAETTTDQIYVVIEQHTKRSNQGEELPLEVENPHVYCDGSENAILVYNSDKTFGLGHINKDICERVNNLGSILVMEVNLDFDNSRLVRTFYAPVTRIEVPVVVEQPMKFFEPIEPQTEYMPTLIECTREEMLAELPLSAKLSDEKLFKIKEQLIGGLHKLNIVVERVKMDIGEKSLTCQLRYDTIPSAISASGFPHNINVFYQLLSIDREEKIMTIDIPYKRQVA